MKKIFILFVALLSVVLQGKAQQYINIYQDDVIIRQFSTNEIDSISVTETEPRIISLWQSDEVIVTYSAAEVDSIKLTSVGGDPLAYIGIVGFNDDLYVKNIGILSSSTASQYKTFVNNLPRKDGTLLYYAVDNALDMLDKSNIQTPLRSVNFITFTDGLDQGSMMMSDKYGSSSAYLEAMSQRIAKTRINDLPINAYSVGLRGNDVSNNTQFSQNLQSLASSSDKAFEVSSINDLRTKLQDIAKQIISVSTRQSISIKVPGIDNGTQMCFVFDGKSAANSSQYIEGTFNLQDRSLYDVTYHGMKSVSGSFVQGTQNGIFVTYTFTGIRPLSGDGLVPTSSITHYYRLPGSTSWQVNSEFSPAGNTQRSVSHSGTSIVLVLDCSSSLGSDFSRMQQYANDFIDQVAANAEPFELVAPTKFKAVYSEDEQRVELSWNAVKYAQNYEIWRCSTAYGTFVKIAENVESNSWTDESPLEGKNYYRLYAVCYGNPCPYVTACAVSPNPVLVDLGLPSGTLWADRNVGADVPVEYGDYFAWGETTPKSDYSWSTYKYGTNIYTDEYGIERGELTKYCNKSTYGENGFVDGLTELEPQDDAAQVNWGGKWRMPSKDQILELYTNTNYTWVSNFEGTGVSGYKFTNKKDISKYIFLPETLERIGTRLNDHDGSFYWSRTLRSDNPRSAYSLFLDLEDDDLGWDTSSRINGQTVRPVANFELLSPSNFKAAFSEDGTSVNLTWDAVKYAQNYEIWRCGSANGSFVKIAENIVSNSWTDESPLGKNYYRLYAICDGSTSPYASAQVTSPNPVLVDLGLPSGTLWADRNVGAEAPEEYGDYFAWGETVPKSDYSWSTYKYGTEHYDKYGAQYYELTKYCSESSYGKDGYTDSYTELLHVDDAASVNWGGNWRMPSVEQIKELLDNTDNTWVSNFEGTGVSGRKFTNKKDSSKFIFLPAAGGRRDASLYDAGSYGYYWSRTLSDIPHDACSLDFNSVSVNWSNNYRNDGQAVRPVVAP